jgi:hypothetical protein
MHRILAIIERDLRASAQPHADPRLHDFPLIQLVVLGYAFGGKLEAPDRGCGWSGPGHAGS